MPNQPFEPPPFEQLSQQWSQTAKTSFAPMVELTGITARMCSELTRQNLKEVNEIMQSQARLLQALSHAKGMEDVLNAQSRNTAEMGNQITENAQHLLDTMLQSAAEYQRWYEKGMEQYYKQGKEMAGKMTATVNKMSDKGEKV